ncbi:protein SERAC1 isoform X2 [Zootermopsis nevadensis]|uniref:protein SERAC1 isoform X2 n=1 Tax=Zootermopsis nevadensis TaxID=136037 RepID=UPI000B8EB2D4|nr:protein SERAC1 isoform X2 [Zootermopsis nevadensis]
MRSNVRECILMLVNTEYNIRNFTDLSQLAGGWFVYQIYKTRHAMSQAMTADYTDHKKIADYIYINDPQFHLMYERNQIFDQARGTKQRTSRFPALFGFWRSLKRSYSWRLVAVARSGDRTDRLKAVQLLAELKNLKDWDCRHVAQMSDARTAVGLAHSEGIDLRFFLKPPNWHLSPSKEELTDKMYNLLLSLNDAKKHPCITLFLSKAFPELQYRHIVFDIDLATMELPQSHIRKDNVLPLSIENLLHHSTIEDNAKDIVKFGGLPLIVNLCKHFKGDIDITIKLVNLLSNISAQDGMLQHFFVTGCIGLLAGWAQHPNIRLSIPATRALANLDMDDTAGIKFSSHLHLLYPSVRHADSPKLDVIFIHGLLGGVYFTWRQRDRKETSPRVSSRVHGQDIGSSVSDEQTKEFLEDMAELKHDEWDELGSDFEMVLSDCPENSNYEGEGPYSFSGCHPCIQQSMEDCKTYISCWPRDWLPQDCHHLRIIGVNYDTNLSMWSPTCPVERVTRNLEYRSKELMKKLTQAGLGSRPIVWVAHSMGGLLVKSLLTKASQDEDEEVHGLCDNTKAVVFYSVPHRGSPLVSLTQATQLLWWPSMEVKELQENSPALLSLHYEFLNLVEKANIEVISFAETKPTFLSSLHLQFRFVPTHSANPGIGEFFEIPRDHLSICKPCSRLSFLYQKLLHLIQKYIPSDE